MNIKPNFGDRGTTSAASYAMRYSSGLIKLRQSTTQEHKVHTYIKNESTHVLSRIVKEWKDAVDSANEKDSEYQRKILQITRGFNRKWMYFTILSGDYSLNEYAFMSNLRIIARPLFDLIWSGLYEQLTDKTVN